MLSRYWLTSFCVGSACCGMSVRFTWSTVSSSSLSVPSTMYGVRKMSSSVLLSVLVVRLKAFPKNGISPSSGTLLIVELVCFCINPPMTTVVWSGVTTTVSAEVLLMIGAAKLADSCTVCVDSELISGETIISTVLLTVMNGVTRRMMPTSW